jgi:4'-phosphopantetheinyl transferase
MYADLTAEELAQSRRFRFACDADRFKFRRAFMRIVLSQQLGLPADEFEMSRTCLRCGDPTHGKPRMADPAGGLHFSVSQTGNVVAIALSTHCEIGLDIEGVSGDVAPLTEQTTPARPMSRSDERSMVTVWTRKESVLKAIGVGLATNLQRVVVSAPHRRPAVRSLPPEFGPPGQFAVRAVHLRPDIIGHVAGIGRVPHVVVHDAAPLLSGSALSVWA